MCNDVKYVCSYRATSDANTLIHSLTHTHTHAHFSGTLRAKSAIAFKTAASSGEARRRGSAAAFAPHSASHICFRSWSHNQLWRVQPSRHHRIGGLEGSECGLDACVPPGTRADNSIYMCIHSGQTSRTDSLTHSTHTFLVLRGLHMVSY